MRRNEPVTHIMTKDPITANLSQKLSEVQQSMAEHGFHHMPVVNGTKLVGILSSTDLLRVTYDYGADPGQNAAVLDNTRTIADVMQPGPLSVSNKATVREVAEIFAKNWFHALPVVDGDELVGIVTTTDVMQYLLEQY